MLTTVWTLSSKEFKTYFRTPIAYVIIAMFLGAGSLFFFQLYPFFEVGKAEMRAFFTQLPLIFFLFIPAITMRVWSEEKKQGTIEPLLCLPVRRGQVVLGKFFGALALLAVILALSFPIPALLYYLGDPDPGPILCGYLGGLLLGAAYIAIGLTASALTENQIIAFILAATICFALYILNHLGLSGILPDSANEILRRSSLDYHFESLGRGVIDSRSVLYYVSVVTFFLVLNSYILQEKTERSPLGFTLISTNLVLLNLVALSYFGRVDLTEDSLYTLHSNTRDIIQRVDDELDVTVFLTPQESMPDQYSTVPRDIRDVLDEFIAIGNPNVNIRILNADDVDVQARAEQARIRPFQAQEQKAGGFEIKKVYWGAVVEYRDALEPIPLLNPKTLEYDLGLCIAKVLRGEVPVVAFNEPVDPSEGLEGSLKDQVARKATFRDRHRLSGDYSRVKSALTQQFEVREISLRRPIDDDVACLVLANYYGIDESAQFFIDQFLMRGGRLCILMDGARIDGRTFNGLARPDIHDEWLADYGVHVRRDVVLDESCASVPMRYPKGMRQERYAPMVQVLKRNLSDDHPITSRFSGGLLMPYAASILLEESVGRHSTILARTTDKAWHEEDVFIFSPDSRVLDPPSLDERSQFDLVGILMGQFTSSFKNRPVPGFAADRLREGLAQDPEENKTPTEIKEEGDIPKVGTLPGAQFGTQHRKEALPDGAYLKESLEPGAIFVVGSSEFITDDVQSAANRTLFLNAVEWLTTGDELLGLRSRVIQARVFGRVEPSKKTLLRLVAGVLMPLSVLMIGLGLYVYRRQVPRKIPRWLKEEKA